MNQVENFHHPLHVIRINDKLSDEDSPPSLSWVLSYAPALHISGTGWAHLKDTKPSPDRVTLVGDSILICTSKFPNVLNFADWYESLSRLIPHGWMAGSGKTQNHHMVKMRD